MYLFKQLYNPKSDVTESDFGYMVIGDKTHFELSINTLWRLTQICAHFSIYVNRSINRTNFRLFSFFRHDTFQLYSHPRATTIFQIIPN